MIQVAVPEKVSPRKKTDLAGKAERLREEALRLDPGVRHFGALDAQHSDEQRSRYKGGDLGWLTKGKRIYRVPDDLLETVFALDAPGTISPVLSSAKGFYIFKLMERQAESYTLLEKVGYQIRRRLEQKKKEALEDRIYREHSEQIGVTVKKEVLNAIEPLPPKYRDPRDVKPPALP